MSFSAQAHAAGATSRTAVVLAICAGISIALGAFAAIGSTAWLATSVVLSLLVLAAWALPLEWGMLLVAALVPWQLYFPLFDTLYSLRLAMVLALALALRVAGAQFRWRIWMLPVAIFLVSALIAAAAAANHYLALKGIFDWLAVLGALYVTSEIVVSGLWSRRVILVLIAGGALEAVLGLVQYGLGLARILDMLDAPASQFLYQPRLLRERMIDLSFNWIMEGRAIPFGTFINAIDYAVYLAAILVIILAMVWNSGVSRDGHWWRTLGLAGSVLLVGGTLLLTLKGSGILALVGGVATVAGLSIRRTLLIQRTPVALVLVAVIVLFLWFADPLLQRAAFLVQREQGAFGMVGRLGIWSQLVSPFLARPLFGYGINNAAPLLEPTRTLSGGAFGFVSTAPESAYVAALIETGAVGLLSLVLLYAATFVRGLRTLSSGNDHGIMIGAMAGLAAILFGNLAVTGFTTDQNGMLMGILMGIVWGEWNLK